MLFRRLTPLLQPQCSRSTFLWRLDVLHLKIDAKLANYQDLYEGNLDRTVLGTMLLQLGQHVFIERPLEQITKPPCLEKAPLAKLMTHTSLQNHMYNA